MERILLITIILTFGLIFTGCFMWKITDNSLYGFVAWGGLPVQFIGYMLYIYQDNIKGNYWVLKLGSSLPLRKEVKN